MQGGIHSLCVFLFCFCFLMSCAGFVEKKNGIFLTTQEDLSYENMYSFTRCHTTVNEAVEYSPHCAIKYTAFEKKSCTRQYALVSGDKWAKLFKMSCPTSKCMCIVLHVALLAV